MFCVEHHHVALMDVLHGLAQQGSKMRFMALNPVLVAYTYIETDEVRQ